MSKPNGRQKKALEALAEALSPPPVERLAEALTECFDAATEGAAERAAERAADRVKTELEPRLDRQDATLRMIWTQCGGNKDERLPIDG